MGIQGMQGINGIDAERKANGRTPVVGYRSTLVSDDSFAYLKAFQAGFPEPRLDLRYIAEAAIQLLRALPREAVERELLRGAREAARAHLALLNRLT